ncbi:MAG: MerR family transcriptional regulator [Pseudomonadota bacterium]
MDGHEDPEAAHGPAPGALVAASDLAKALDVPPSVLTFLEERFHDVSAVVRGRERLYRARDAALMAGLSRLLYGDGVPLRTVLQMAQSDERSAILARGREFLGALLPEDVAPQPAAKDLPPDVVVGRPGAPPSPAERPRQAGAKPVTREAIHTILAELVACKKRLDDVR